MSNFFSAVAFGFMLCAVLIIVILEVYNVPRPGELKRMQTACESELQHGNKCEFKAVPKE